MHESMEAHGFHINPCQFKARRNGVFISSGPCGNSRMPVHALLRAILSNELLRTLQTARRPFGRRSSTALSIPPHRNPPCFAQSHIRFGMEDCVGFIVPFTKSRIQYSLALYLLTLRYINATSVCRLASLGLPLEPILECRLWP